MGSVHDSVLNSETLVIQCIFVKSTQKSFRKFTIIQMHIFLLLAIQELEKPYLLHHFIQEGKGVKYSDGIKCYISGQSSENYYILDLPTVQELKISISSPIHIVIFSPGKEKIIRKLKVLLRRGQGRIEII